MNEHELVREDIGLEPKSPTGELIQRTIAQYASSQDSGVRQIIIQLEALLGKLNTRIMPEELEKIEDEANKLIQSLPEVPS